MNVNLQKLLSESVKSFEKVKYISFLVNQKHKSILNKYLEIWDKIKEHIGKNLHSGVHHKNQTSKVKFCNNEIKTDFHGERILIE